MVMIKVNRVNYLDGKKRGGKKEKEKNKRYI